jgi:hypothetical protein
MLTLSQRERTVSRLVIQQQRERPQRIAADHRLLGQRHSAAHGTIEPPLGDFPQTTAVVWGQATPPHGVFESLSHCMDNHGLPIIGLPGIPHSRRVENMGVELWIWTTSACRTPASASPCPRRSQRMARARPNSGGPVRRRWRRDSPIRCGHYERCSCSVCRRGHSRRVCKKQALWMIVELSGSGVSAIIPLGVDVVWKTGFEC